MRVAYEGTKIRDDWNTVIGWATSEDGCDAETKFTPTYSSRMKRRRMAMTRLSLFQRSTLSFCTYRRRRRETWLRIREGGGADLSQSARVNKAHSSPSRLSFRILSIAAVRTRTDDRKPIEWGIGGSVVLKRHNLDRKLVGCFRFLATKVRNNRPAASIPP
ncbi:hypothetical protein H4582DRAFT_115202 [Lactarius indigo]|nr:hypothetical protein H4582DRAFT_115202 [Lactarius indigo]